MSQTIAIAGRDLSRLVTLAVEMGSGLGSPTLIESKHAVEALTGRPLHPGSSAVILLTGDENIGDLLSLFKANPGVAFVLLSGAFPPHHAVARVVAEHHGAVLPAGESPVVIAATLVALLSRRGAVAV